MNDDFEPLIAEGLPTEAEGGSVRTSSPIIVGHLNLIPKECLYER